MLSLSSRVYPLKPLTQLELINALHFQIYNRKLSIETDKTNTLFIVVVRARVCVHIVYLYVETG